MIEDPHSIGCLFVFRRAETVVMITIIMISFILRVALARLHRAPEGFVRTARPGGGHDNLRPRAAWLPSQAPSEPQRNSAVPFLLLYVLHGFCSIFVDI